MTLDLANVATWIVLAFTAVGAVLVILCAIIDVDPTLRLSYNAYLDKMVWAWAGLAVGRGIKAAGAAR
ncbi:MAG TPA: hypothetical protein VN213_02710 [Solirubrobacteraceae bacterium]|nr:hypothetical protein [Solirubrobacteraceae bacterium]